MPKKAKPKVTSIQDLEMKSTKELLAYLRKLHQCEESYELSDLTINPDFHYEMTIYFKNTAKWETAYKNVKTVLANREHIN